MAGLWKKPLIKRALEKEVNITKGQKVTVIDKNGRSFLVQNEGDIFTEIGFPSRSRAVEEHLRFVCSRSIPAFGPILSSSLSLFNETANLQTKQGGFAKYVKFKSADFWVNLDSLYVSKTSKLINSVKWEDCFTKKDGNVIESVAFEMAVYSGAENWLSAETGEMLEGDWIDQYTGLVMPLLNSPSELLRFCRSELSPLKFNLIRGSNGFSVWDCEVPGIVLVSLDGVDGVYFTSLENPWLFKKDSTVRVDFVPHAQESFKKAADKTRGEKTMDVLESFPVRENLVKVREELKRLDAEIVKASSILDGIRESMKKTCGDSV